MTKAEAKAEAYLVVIKRIGEAQLQGLSEERWEDNKKIENALNEIAQEMFQRYRKNQNRKNAHKDSPKGGGQ